MSNRRRHKQNTGPAPLYHLAIVHHSAMGSGEVRAVDLRTNQPCWLTPKQVTAVTRRPQRWSVLMCVMTDDKRMHTDIARAAAPCLQSDLALVLEQPHRELLARVQTIIGLEGKGVQVHSYGWIAMPVRQDLQSDKAERVFAAALKTIGRAA